MLESDIAQIKEALGVPDLFQIDENRFHELSRNLVDFEKELEATEEKWLILSEMLEKPFSGA